MIVRLCNIECSVSKPLEDAANEPAENGYDNFPTNLKKWHEITNHLYIWDYTTNFTNMSTSFPNFNAIRKNARFFKENGISGVFEQGNSSCLNGEFGELRGYLLAKLLWNPYMTESEFRVHMADFCTDYYGAAAKHMMQYIDFEHECLHDIFMTIYFDDSSNIIYMDGYKDHSEGAFAFYDKAARIFDEAEAAAWEAETALTTTTSAVRASSFTTTITLFSRERWRVQIRRKRRRSSVQAQSRTVQCSRLCVNTASPSPVSSPISISHRYRISISASYTGKNSALPAGDILPRAVHIVAPQLMKQLLRRPPRHNSADGIFIVLPGEKSFSEERKRKNMEIHGFQKLTLLDFPRQDRLYGLSCRMQFQMSVLSQLASCDREAGRLYDRCRSRGIPEEKTRTSRRSCDHRRRADALSGA